MLVNVPHNIEAEQALIGAVLVNNDAYAMVSNLLEPDDLFEPAHQEIFRVIGTEISAGRKATPVTLKDMLPHCGILNMTLSQYLAHLCAESTTIINAPDYAARIRSLSIMRHMIAVGDVLATTFTSPDDALREAWDSLDQIRAALSGANHHRSSIHDLAMKVLDDDGSFAIPTTLSDFDRATAGGLRSGRLLVLGGRPSMGKSLFLCSVSRRIARQGIGVSIFSLETDAKEVTARLIADELARTDYPIVYRDILARNLTDADFERVQVGAERVQVLPIRIDDASSLGIAEIEARARMDRDRMAKAGTRLGVVMIDYLGLVKCSDRYRGRKVDEIGEITAACKIMAKRLNVAVVLLAQLNRQVESRDDKRPGMSDLRESGNIEQDADIVGLLYRPVYYIERSAEFRRDEPDALRRYSDSQNKLELILGKNRLGAAATIELWCNPGTSSVDNWSHIK
ncbi:MAG: DnaB domain protein helicase domain protein [Bradyrhizobium sp.]|nr:DnaB domain protein helicase domain protein [Bradyrhizobium sp.]